MRRSRRPSIRWLVATCLASLLMLPAPVSGSSSDCGHPAVAVHGAVTEIDAACRALRNVLDAFMAMGLVVEPRFELVFKDTVVVELVDDPLSPPGGNSQLEVSAFFDARALRMEVTSFEDAGGRGRRPWGLEWTPAIGLSILHHELAHMASLSVLGADYALVGRPWLELIAYSVEFEVMPEELRGMILARHQDLKPFATMFEVNGMTLAIDPDSFGLRAHLTSRAHGGLEFVRRVLQGEVPFSRADILWRP